MDAARQRGAETRRRRTRTKIFASGVRQAKSPERQAITVASICSEAGISTATFYYHYASVEEMLTEMLNMAVRRVLRKIEASDCQADGSQLDLVRNAVEQVIEMMVGFPSLFEMSVPREWIQIISSPLVHVLSSLGLEAINSDQRIALLISEYHVNAWVGMIKRHLMPNVDVLTSLAITQIASTVIRGQETVLDTLYWDFSDRVYEIATPATQSE